MKCPGQDMQYWNAEAIFEIACPKCGKPVEFYKDDTNRRCHHCGNRFVNPKMDFGCAAYCQYAEQCLGTLPEEFVGTQDNLLKDKVAVEMKRFFRNDFHRIAHASRVARYAESIGKLEGGNLAVVVCAAYLHDIDRDPLADEARDQSSIIARDILLRLKAKEVMVEAVCTLLEQQHKVADHHSPEYLILEDAKHLARLEEMYKQEGSTVKKAADLIRDELQTAAGQEEAGKLIAKYIS